MRSADARVADAVWQLAQKRDINLKELAGLLQLPYRTVQNYMTGEVKIPASFIERCCDLFRIEADYLLFGHVGIDVVAMEDAIAAVLSSVIPRFELDGRTVVISKEGKAPLSDKAQFHHNAAVVLEIAEAIQEKYEQLRADAVRSTGRGNVSVRAQAVDAGMAPLRWGAEE